MVTNALPYQILCSGLTDVGLVRSNNEVCLGAFRRFQILCIS